MIETVGVSISVVSRKSKVLGGATMVGAGDRSGRKDEA
jgi:hypothetical protein